MHPRLGKIFVSALCLYGLGPVLIAEQSAAAGKSLADSCTAGDVSGAVTVHAETHGAPYLNLCDGRAQAAHVGSSPAARAGIASVQPTMLVSGDFDEDGVPDLVSGFSTGKSGSITVHRGNRDALWPYGAALRNGPPAAFLPNPRQFALPEVPDFIAAGDFDADGHWDIVAARRGGTALYFLKGDGHGGFRAAKSMPLNGKITAMISGEINRADGLADLVVALDTAQGPRVLVFESPLGAWKAQPETFTMAHSVTALALGRFDGGAMNDLAIGEDDTLVVIHARDRKLWGSQAQRASVPAARMTVQKLSFSVQALATGDFTGAGPSVAALGDDGQIHILEHTLAEDNLFQRMIADPEFEPTMAAAKLGKDGKPMVARGTMAPSIAARVEALRRLARVESEGPEWTEKAALALPQGFSQRVPQLVTARLTGSLQHDILAPDSGSNLLHVFSTVASAHRPGTKATGVAAEPAKMKLLASLEAETAPLAVLPMRLTKSGLHGLVLLQERVNTPVTLQQSIPPANVFTVTNTSDAIIASSQPTQYTGPAGSLRAAMFNANNATGAAEIDFNIPTSDAGYNATTGAFLIQPLSEAAPGAFIDFALPPINNTMIIDGYTQPGASPNTSSTSDNAKILIEIDGAKATTPGGAGLVPFDDTGSTFRGLDFTGWTNPDISSGSGGETASGAEGIEANGVGDYIEGNFFGTDPTGKVAKNAKSGTSYGNRIGVFADNGPAFGNTDGGSVIGGTTPAARNILSNNDTGGILFLSTAFQGRLEGNFVGLDASGAKALPNTFDGAGSNGPTIVFGGTLAGDGNVISANGTNIDFNDITNGGQASGSMAQGNLIGTDATGRINISKGTGSGASITYGPTDETIGGTTPAARNILSGNYYGVYIANATTGIVVQGNFIGTDITGTKALGNAQQGFYQAQTDTNSTAPGYTVLGGATAGAGNLISGNVLDGVAISGTVLADSGQGAPEGNTIQGNYIGTDVTGAKPLANGGAGISLGAEATNNVIGGSVPGEGNVISYNTSHGVLIDSSSNGYGNNNNTVGNTILSNGGNGVRINSGIDNLISRNSIYKNGALGIALGTGGKNINTVCNATNTGPNNSQNAPVLTGSAATGAFYTATATDPNGNTSEFSNAVNVALTGGNVLDLVGSFNSVASTTYTIEFFSSPTADTSGYGQGLTYIGSTQVTTGTNCSAPVSNSPTPGEADLSIKLTGPSSGLQIGPDFGSQVYTASVTNLGPSTATSVVVTDTLPAGLAISSLYCDLGPCQSSITTNLGTCTVSGQTISCNLGTLAAGQTAAVNIPVQALTSGNIADVATVSSAVTDPVMSNNTSSLTEAVTYPEPFIDISSSGTVPNIEPDSVLAGSSDTLVTIYGTGFLPSSTVSLNGTNLPVVSFVDNQLCAFFDPYYCAAIEVNVPASMLTATGTPTIAVSNPNPFEGGGANTPSTATFNIVSACSFSVSPDPDFSIGLPAGGSDPIAEQVSVAANAAGCTWSGSSSVNWVVPLESAPVATTSTQYDSSLYTTMDFAVAPNSTSTTRNGTINIAGQVFSFSQAGGAPCDYTLSSKSGNFSAAGGAGSFGVTIHTIQSGALCSPSVETNIPNYPTYWITVPLDYVPDSGTVTFKVAANTGAARTGTIMIGGYVYTVNQAAPPCTYSLTPNSALSGTAAGTGEFAVTASAASCAWTATSSDTSVVSVTSGASGKGNGTVKYSLAANSSGPQTPTIAVSDTKGGSSAFTITQSSNYTCTFALSPASVEVPASGGSNFFEVSASNSVCSWRAASNNPTAVAVSGTQSNAVLYTVGQNTSTQARTLTITAGCETFTIIQAGAAASNPVPAITSLQPSGATAGAGAFTLTVNGSGFINGSVVDFNGKARTTKYVSAKQVTAAILASDIAKAGKVSVTVSNSSPGGGTSNAVSFTIAAGNNPVPTLTKLSPATATAGGAAFKLTVTGSNFIASSVIDFNGTVETTTFVSATSLTATIPATAIAKAGTLPVTVKNPAPGGGTSNAIDFTVSAAGNPVPTVTKLSPATATAGGAAFKLTVTGSNFIASSVIDFNGTAETTTFVSATSLTATIPATAIAKAGSLPVTVKNPAPGGGTSNAIDLKVSAANNPVPAITTLQPSKAVAGSGAFTLTINGTGFLATSTASFDGNAVTATFVSDTEITASIPASAIAKAGSDAVTVTNPAPGGGTSTPVDFTVTVPNNPVPAITSLSPSGVKAGAAAFTLTVNGTGFIKTSSVSFNGNGRTTTFVSSTQLTAAIQAADVAQEGSFAVIVTSPAPGGGTSNSVNFAVSQANNPVPTVTALQPARATAGSGAFTLTVTGTNFIKGSTVNFNGNPKATTFVSATEVTAAILASDIATAATDPVTVTNPAPGGGTSNSIDFTVSQANNPSPAITTIAPASAIAGSGALTLTVNGTGFIQSSVVSLNGSALATTYVSGTEITASIPAAAVATAGTPPVTVTNPSPGGGTSSAVTFTVDNPAPTVTGIQPQSAVAGSAAFALTVNGTGFNASSVVRFNGAAKTTTLVSSTQVTAAIPAADVAKAGTIPVTVSNPAPGGGKATPVTFTIAVATAPIASLTPASLTFSNTVVGAKSSTQTITLSNTGNAALNISGITLAGADPSDFAEADTCGQSLAAGSTCPISITFAPTASGSLSATLSVADDAAGSPQTAALQGTATPQTGDFALSSPTGSQTVAAGGAATFTISVATTPSGDVFDNPVTLTASGLPAGAMATFSPASVTPGTGSATSTLTIQTASQATAASNAVRQNPASPWPLYGPAAAFVFGTFGLFFWRRKNAGLLRKLSMYSLLAALAIGAMGLVGCGGGFALKQQSNAKTYDITVTGTAGAVQHSATVKLTVQQ